MDLFGGFLEDGCVTEDGAWITAKDLYAAYQRWCEANGEKPRSQKALSMGLRERGFENFRTKKARCWRGIRLRREDEPLPATGDGWVTRVRSTPPVPTNRGMVPRHHARVCAHA